MADIYVATGGNDSNDGAIDSPIATWSEARDRVSAGDTVHMREGTYRERLLLYNDNGDPGSPITVEAYQGENVVFDQGGWPSRIKAHHIRLDGLTFTNGDGVVLVKPDTYDVVVRNCESYNNAGDGFSINEEAHDVEFHNCASHHNHDGEPFSSEEGNRNADGFNVTLRAYDVRFYGCDAYHNIDDGYDTNQAGSSTRFYNCRAWDNGLNPNDTAVGNGAGFKLQNDPSDVSGDPVAPNVLLRCAAWNNRHNIRVRHAWPDTQIINCTAFAPNHAQNWIDAGRTFWNFLLRDFGASDRACTVKNSIAAGPNGQENRIAYNVTESNDTWTLGTSDPQFASTDPSSNKFLRLDATSSCIDAGTTETGSVSVEYEGAAPDLGAYEYSTAIRIRDGGSFVTPRTVRYYDGAQWLDVRVKAFDGDRFVTAFGE